MATDGLHGLIVFTAQVSFVVGSVRPRTVVATCRHQSQSARILRVNRAACRRVHSTRYSLAFRRELHALEQRETFGTLPSE